MWYREGKHSHHKWRIFKNNCLNTVYTSHVHIYWEQILYRFWCIWSQDSLQCSAVTSLLQHSSLRQTYQIQTVTKRHKTTEKFRPIQRIQKMQKDKFSIFQSPKHILPESETFHIPRCVHVCMYTCAHYICMCSCINVQTCKIHIPVHNRMYIIQQQFPHNMFRKKKQVSILIQNWKTAAKSVQLTSVPKLYIGQYWWLGDMKCIGNIVQKTRANSATLLTRLLYLIPTEQPITPHTINLPMKM